MKPASILARLRGTSAALATAAALSFAPLGAPSALVLDVTIDTSSFNGDTAFLEFLLVDGDEVVNNSMVVSGFSTDGTLEGPVASSSGVSGVLPADVTIGDPDFINEYLEQIVLGDEISFILDISENYTPSAALQDTFTVALFSPSASDPTGPGDPLEATTDPVLDALFFVELTANGPILEVYESEGGELEWTVPAPGVLGLLGLGLVLSALVRRRRFGC